VLGVVGQRAARLAARDVRVDLLLLAAGQRATVHADGDEQYHVVTVHAS
jgi:hypothetical protein